MTSSDMENVLTRMEGSARDMTRVLGLIEKLLQGQVTMAGEIRFAQAQLKALEERTDAAKVLGLGLDIRLSKLECKVAGHIRQVQVAASPLKTPPSEGVFDA